MLSRRLMLRIPLKLTDVELTGEAVLIVVDVGAVVYCSMDYVCELAKNFHFEI